MLEIQHLPKRYDDTPAVIRKEQQIVGRRFWRVDRPAGLLLLPYAAWVTCATVLNGAIGRMNWGRKPKNRRVRGHSAVVPNQSPSPRATLPP